MVDVDGSSKAADSHSKSTGLVWGLAAFEYKLIWEKSCPTSWYGMHRHLARKRL